MVDSTINSPEVRESKAWLTSLSTHTRKPLISPIRPRTHLITEKTDSRTEVSMMQANKADDDVKNEIRLRNKVRIKT